MCQPLWTYTIQDLQVKSSPAAQAEQIHNDPAIIQVLTF